MDVVKLKMGGKYVQGWGKDQSTMTKKKKHDYKKITKRVEKEGESKEGKQLRG